MEAIEMSEMPRKALILDLDGTLEDADYCTDDGCEHEIFSTGGMYSSGGTWFLHIRPHCREFLEWAHTAGWEFIIFSAANTEYVQRITNIIFTGLPFKPLAVFNANSLTLRAGDYVKLYGTVSKEMNIPIHRLLAIDDHPGNFPDGHFIKISEWEKTDDDDAELVHIRQEIADYAALLNGTTII
jgi:hypothetical protein